VQSLFDDVIAVLEVCPAAFVNVETVWGLNVCSEHTWWTSLPPWNEAKNWKQNRYRTKYFNWIIESRSF